MKSAARVVGFALALAGHAWADVPTLGADPISAVGELPASDGAGHSLAAPVVITEPSLQQIGGSYPEDEERMGRDGQAVVHCLVSAAGSLTNCQVVSASSLVFGAATMRIARLLKVRPATQDGLPVKAGMTISVAWTLALARAAGY